MNSETFWRLISLIATSELSPGSDDAAVAPLVHALADLAPREIRSFEDRLAQALYALDGQAFADAAGPNGESGDAFLYGRCYVVAHGKEHYSAVLSGRLPMPQSLEEWCEPLLYAAANAWALRTGGDPDDWDHETVVSWETGSHEALWPPRDRLAEPDPFDEPVLERAASRAGHQFRAGNYDNVVKLLAPHENRLSGKLSEILRIARTGIDGQP